MTLPSLGSPDSNTVYAKIGTSVTVVSKAIDLAGNGNVFCSPEVMTYQAYVNNGSADVAVASIVQVPTDGGATTAVASHSFTATVATSWNTYIRNITSAVVTTTTTAAAVTTTTTSGGGTTTTTTAAVPSVPADTMACPNSEFQVFNETTSEVDIATPNNGSGVSLGICGPSMPSGGGCSLTLCAGDSVGFFGMFTSSISTVISIGNYDPNKTYTAHIYKKVVSGSEQFIETKQFVTGSLFLSGYNVIATDKIKVLIVEA
jgi:hypothetical protein